MEIKRGSTFFISFVVKVDGVVQDLTNWDITSGAKSRFGVKHPFNVTFPDRANGVFELEGDTTSWIPGPFSYDIVYVTDSAQKVISPSVPFDLVESDT